MAANTASDVPETAVAGAPAGRLGDRLVQAGVARRMDVERAASVAAASGRLLGEVLTETAAAEERDVFRELAEQRGLRFAAAEEVLERIDRGLAEAVPRRFLATHRVIPFAREGKTVLAATDDPKAVQPAALPELADVLRAGQIGMWLLCPTDFRRVEAALALGQVPAAPAVPAAGVPLSPPGEPEDLDDELLHRFDALLLDAIGERASDIHLERYGETIRVRLRVDGDLHDLDRYHLTPAQHAGLTNVLKIKARLDIAERRLPQGGRFSTAVSGRSFDVRVQTQPSLHGEHTVLRLLGHEVRPLSIRDLGFPPDLARRYRRMIDSPSGLVLVVGPTGSGKTTTLYAALQILARDTTRKVISIEDPIEYAIDGIQQTQAQEELGFGFASAMRVFVRQDPDVILLGEVRDAETALEAIRASQTGHLVLTTLHSNDAVDAVQRLFDLGMHPGSVASELLAVFAQRLAKRICPGCREEAELEPELAEEVFPGGVPSGFTAFRGKGCPRCDGRGTHGRIAVVEHLAANPALRRAIARELPVDDLRDVAFAAGLRPMREQALGLVREGVIPFAELGVMLPPERLAPPEREKGSA